MSQPLSSRPEQPEPVDEPVPEASEAAEGEPTAESEPLNRAARRAKAKQSDPSHVGPRPGYAPTGRGGRSHTKRRIG
jgi:hypothetical protein